MISTARPPALTRADPRTQPTVVLVSPRVQHEPKYWPRLARYIQGFRQAPYLVRTWEEATDRSLLDGAPVECVRVHSVARRADGTPLLKPSRRMLRRLLRRGRVLSHDALTLSRALEALGAGAKRVRLGTLESLAQGAATVIS